MAVAYENSLTPITVTFAAAGETETHAFDAGTGSNRVLLVTIFWRDNDDSTISGVTYNGVAMTELAAKTRSAQNLAGHMWRLANPASGSNNIAVTMAADAGDSTGMITAWVGNGCDIVTTPVDSYAANSGTGSTANIVSSVTVSGDNGDRIVSFHYTFNLDGNITATPTGYTERQDTASGGGHSTELGDANGSASLDSQATWSNGAFAVSWVALGVNVNQAAAAETITLDKWLGRYEVRRGVKAAMVPSGMTPPDRIES
jgi:hypothetical protein